MALTELTKVTGPGIHTLSNILSHNIKSSGIITATKFSGPLDSIGGNFAGVITATNGVFSGNISAVDGNFSGNVTIGGTLTYEDVTNIDSVGIITARDGLKVLGGGANIVGVVTATGADINGDLDVDGHTNLANVSVAGVSTFSNSVKFVGTTSGRDLNWNYGTNTLTLADHVLLGLGNSNDLLLHHTGTTGYIKGQTGNLYIQSDQVVVIGNQTASTVGFKFTNGGAAEVFFNNNNKLQTTNTGINVTGNTVADGLVIDGNSDLNGDLDVDGHTNLDNVSIAGVTTTSGLLDVNGLIEATAGQNKIPFLYGAMADLPSAGSYHGMFAHVHATGRGYFAHGGGWYELVNKESNGVVGTGTETYSIGNITATGLDLNGDIDVDGHTNLDNVNIAGVTTASGLLDIDGGGRANTFKVEDLTSGRVVLAGSGGELEDSNNLRFDGSNLFVSGINVLTSSGSASTSIIGEDIVTRNFKATGISTVAGPIQLIVRLKLVVLLEQMVIT